MRRNAKIQKAADKEAERLLIDSLRSAAKEFSAKMEIIDSGLAELRESLESIQYSFLLFQDEIKDIQRDVENLNNALEDVDTHNLVTGDNFNEFLESGLDGVSISVKF